jgi:hypothetical protein
MSNKSVYAILALFLLIIEVIIATKLTHYHFIRHYIGDFLVVILLYFIIKAMVDIKDKPLAIAIFIFAVCIEVTQYFHLADKLQLEQGGVLRIVIGTHFSVSDLAMYAMGCLFVYWFDRFIFKKT